MSASVRLVGDPDVVALRRFLGDRPKRRREVAAVLQVSEQTLYQIVTGIKLPSGRTRGVGRQLRERLDEHFPGWREQDSDGRPLGVTDTVAQQRDLAARLAKLVAEAGALCAQLVELQRAGVKP